MGRPCIHEFNAKGEVLILSQVPRWHNVNLISKYNLVETNAALSYDK